VRCAISAGADLEREHWNEKAADVGRSFSVDAAVNPARSESE